MISCGYNWSQIIVDPVADKSNGLFFVPKYHLQKFVENVGLSTSFLVILPIQPQKNSTCTFY